MTSKNAAIQSLGLRSLNLFKTQKAKGFYYLSSLLQPFTRFGVYGSKEFYIFPVKTPKNFPLFARPCPTKPRHGFVESRTVYNDAEALEIVAETLRADPLGEVIFTPFLDGQWSYVATNAGISVGEGNAGVTGGARVFTLPCPIKLKTWNNWIDWFDITGAASKESPCLYFEAVQDGNKVYGVQLRGGPEVDIEHNYVPQQTSVTRVVSLQDTREDLLLWEKKVSRFKKGTVVWMPEASLLSHYAIHCINNKVPVVTDSLSPEIGDVLLPTSKQGLPIPEQSDIACLAQKIREGLKKDALGVVYAERKTLFALAVAHVSQTWPWTTEFILLRVIGYIWLLRFAAIACIGEARHFFTAGPGRPGEVDRDMDDDYKARREPCVNWEALNFPRSESLNLCWARHQVCDNAGDLSLPRLMSLLKAAKKDLEPPGWQFGIGGEPWVSAAERTLRFFSALVRLRNSPNAANYKNLANTFNLLANATHNGGALVNKWAPQSCINDVAEIPTLAFLNNFAIETILGVVREGAKKNG